MPADGKADDERFERFGKLPRAGEVAIDWGTFAGVAKRAGLREGDFDQRPSVARSTIRRVLGLADLGAIVNVNEEPMRKLVSFLGEKLGEPLEVDDFVCELDLDTGAEIDDFRRRIRRELIIYGANRHPIAALATLDGVYEFLSDEENASELWATLVNNYWQYSERRHYWMCSFREASAYVAYLRSRKDTELEFYCSRKTYGLQYGKSVELLLSTGWSYSIFGEIMNETPDVFRELKMRYALWRNDL